MPDNTRVDTSGKFQNIILWLVGIFAFLLPSSYLFVEWYEVKQSIEWEKLTKEDVEKFNAIQSKLKSKPYLQSEPCIKNAGKVLHKIIPWRVPEHKEESFSLWKDLLDTSYVSSLTSFQSRINNINSLQVENTLTNDSLTTLTFPNENPKWFEEIAQDYDCWDLDQDSPRSGIFPFALQEPLPRYDIIYNWGLFYTLEGVQNKKDLKTIGKTLEGWTKLLMSTEHLDANFLALQFLMWQNEILSKDPSIPTSNYLSKEELQQLTFLLYNAPRFYGLWTDEESLSHIPLEGIAVCAGLREGLRFGWLYQQPLRDRYIKKIEHMEEALTHCRLELPQALWNMSSLKYLQKKELFCSSFPNNIHCTIAKRLGSTPHYILPILSEYQLEKQESFWKYSK